MWNDGPERDWCPVGVIRSVNPARREVRITPGDGCGPCFKGIQWLHVMIDGERVRCKVDQVSPHNEIWIARLGAGVLRETVSQMRGATVTALRSSLLAGPGGEWPLVALVGLEMHGPNGSEGVVTEASRNKAQTVVELERPGGHTARLVLVPGLVIGVDTEEGVVRVNDLTPYVVDDAD